jgi:uncharacterized protein (DUF488 family)
MPLTMWTIGHSTRSTDEFLAALAAFDIELLVDVRRLPGSRRLPQFDAESLEQSLGLHGVSYRWLSALGGRRRPDPESLNVAWRHRSFRAYADHVASEEFAGGLFELLMLAGGLRTVIMCAEVLWWRCHRRLIADALLIRGWKVLHLDGNGLIESHELTGFASFDQGRLTYPEPQTSLDL